MTRPRAKPRQQISRRRALRLLVASAAGVVSPRTATAAAAPWVDVRHFGPFVCRAAFALDAELIAEFGLDRLELELRRVLALRPCREPIEVLLSATRADHRRLLSRRCPDAPNRRALFHKIDGRATVYAYRHDELPIDLRHEATHALLHADLPTIPLWLDEGLAEYFEPVATLRPYGPHHLDRAIEDARDGRLTRLADLEARDELAGFGESDYRHAWAWVHFLLHGPHAATTQLWAYLAALRRASPPGRVSDRLAAALGSPERAIADHLAGWPVRLRAAGGSSGASR